MNSKALYEAISKLIDLPTGAAKIVITLESNAEATVTATFPAVRRIPMHGDDKPDARAGVLLCK